MKLCPINSVNKRSELSSVQEQFRNPGLSYSFGYGLGVFQQAGYNAASNPQLDVIHIVDDPVRFHRLNAAKFPKHYSSLIKLPDSAIQWIQDCGAGVYFNPYVSMTNDCDEKLVLKYGVVSNRSALMDLRDWTSLYIAGRLQKPVEHVFSVNDELKRANEYNLESAFNLSLLMLLRRCGSSLFSAIQLFEQIALISYMGDPRMLIGGENPNKVKNIVSKQLPFFEQLYSKAFDNAISKGYMKRQGGDYDLKMKPRSAAEILASLPKNFKWRFLNSYRNKYGKLLTQDKVMLDYLEGNTSIESLDSILLSHHASSLYLNEALSDSTSKRVLLSTILNIIAFPALTQSVKGILTAGLGKSVRYAWEKKLKSMSPRTE
ncbi:mitochondrial matrix Mmp37 [Metschnikowia bicuspidata var. bicuspidata NRRL YB-4993]|uniref:Phosphatidate cytidylyltransferase, mitochondrial n=1 Tax=Metschnikowia bicuspidata var. bicuspidata NRRL YB-4993 TaxID=869754 RepID=A0A1A0HIV2_9ASCO|nr:mitochondrial matrix Mmp37 [Metschnikowia bicuspidata var. bicuspidata NRRL YB-4993]OBA23940.1 mitochondrial matrix Mmp37 [Metschnikowia bicuspidata var. bicuspidata NRRL YB-4993]